MAGSFVAFTTLQRVWAIVCTFQENKPHPQPGKALTETLSKTTCNFHFDCIADVRVLLF